MSGWLGSALVALAGSPFLQGALAALATFVLEDATAVTCGLLVAAEQMSTSTALIGLSLGIAVGDLGLHGIGRVLGPRIVARGWVRQKTLDDAARRLDRHATLALIGCRFVPGLRLPTFLASGVLRTRLGVMLPVVVVASVVWVTLLLYVTVRADGALLLPLGGARWIWGALVVAVVAIGPWAFGRATRVTARAGTRVASRFEFWPAWLFYPPVAVWYALLALRYRSLLLPTAANPSIHAGGLIGESKSAVLDLVSGEARRFVPAYAVIERAAGATREELLAAALRAMRERGVELPVVAKPDLGMRGAGVWPCRSEDEIADYLAAFPTGARVVLQRLAGDGSGTEGPTVSPRLRGVREAGVLWWRDPETGRSAILSITLKRFPALVGDGRARVRELILSCPRARLLRKRYFARHAAHLDRVLAAGEPFPLVFAGNHCQGALFFDGTDLATDELRRRIDGIALSMRDFYFGRFDVRFDDVLAFLRGDELRIVEINGAGAEATHVWDPSTRLLDAWGALCRQWSVLFRVGAANRRRGATPSSPAQFLRDAMAYRRLAAAYPATR